MAAAQDHKIGSRMLGDRVPLCWFNRHHPDRDDVAWDGYNYVGTCRHCTAAIRRREKRRWERDWIAVKETA